MTLRVVMATGTSGSCNPDEVMVSALCVGVPVSAATENSATCIGDAKPRLVCAKK